MNVKNLRREEILVFPGNAFLEKLKNFMTDESIALLFNLGATWGIRFLLGSSLFLWFAAHGIDTVWIFAFAGPVFEKFAFWIRPYFEAWQTYRHTSKHSRKHYSYYRKRATKEGFWTLFKDIVGHDTLYVAGMVLFQSKYPDTPPELICVFVFFVAVFLVSIVEYLIMEIWYLGVIWSLNAWSWKVITIELASMINLMFRAVFKTPVKGLTLFVRKQREELDFSVERYYEARVLYEDKEEAEKVFKRLIDDFSLGIVMIDHDNGNGYQTVPGKTMEGKYRDRYLNLKVNKDELENLTPFNNRLIRLRFRERENECGFGCNKSLQLVVTRAGQFARRHVNQVRFYIVKKVKWYHAIKKDMVWVLKDLPSERIAKKMESRLRDKKNVEVVVHRKAAQNPDTILASLDCFEGYCAIEIKAYSRAKRLLMDALDIALADKRYLTVYSKDLLVKMKQPVESLLADEIQPKKIIV